MGEGGGFTNNSCIDSLYYTNSQGEVNTTNARRSRKKAFEQVVTIDEEKLVSRLLHECEEKIRNKFVTGVRRNSLEKIVTEGEIKLITWCYRSRRKMMSRMLHEQEEKLMSRLLQEKKRSL